MRRELRRILRAYAAEHDLRRSTERQYARILDLFGRFARGRISSQAANAWLRDLEDRERSAYYRRSCRATLHAVLGLPRLRSVRCQPLEPRAWTMDELRRLMAACHVAGRHAEWFRLVIQLGYHTGLSACDLFAIRKEQIASDGTLHVRRSKTGAAVFVWIPPELLASLPERMSPPYSVEMVRRVFHRICHEAGVSGPLKQLRRTSGTLAEDVAPGHGHEHLGDSRVVFERHYLDRHPEPIRLPRIDSVS